LPSQEVANIDGQDFLVHKDKLLNLQTGEYRRHIPLSINPMLDHHFCSGLEQASCEERVKKLN